MISHVTQLNDVKSDILLLFALLSNNYKCFSAANLFMRNRNRRLQFTASRLREPPTSVPYSFLVGTICHSKVQKARTTQKKIALCAERDICQVYRRKLCDRSLNEFKRGSPAFLYNCNIPRAYISFFKFHARIHKIQKFKRKLCNAKI